VSEMMLNVQSVFPLDFSNHKAIEDIKLKLKLTSLWDSYN